MKLTTLNVVSPVASISLLIGSDVHHFVFTVYISFFHLIVNGFCVTCNNNNYHNQLLSGFSRSVQKQSLHHLYHKVTYFPVICAFIISFSFTVWTKKFAKKVLKQVRGCLQNLYKSVAIHPKYVLLVLL